MPRFSVAALKSKTATEQSASEWSTAGMIAPGKAGEEWLKRTCLLADPDPAVTCSALLSPPRGSFGHGPQGRYRVPVAVSREGGEAGRDLRRLVDRRVRETQ